MIFLWVLLLLVNSLSDETSGESSLEQCNDDSNRTGGTLDDLDKEKFWYADYYLPSQRRAGGNALGAKFRNFRNERLYKYWDNGSPEGVYNGFIEPLGFGATNTYVGHTFIYRDKKWPDGKEITRHTMENGKNIYIIPPVEEWVKDTKEYKRTMEEKAFMEEYYERTGQPWLAEYERGPTLLPIWESRYVGQEHLVSSEYGYVNCGPMKAKPHCVEEGPVNITLYVASTQPKVLIIPNLMSFFEADHILKLAKPRMGRSSVGNGAAAFKSETRTSKTAWLRRTDTDVMNHIFSRFADVLNIPNDILTHDKVAENLQIVEYQNSQEYAPHHDFGSDGKIESRYATLLLTISDVPELENVHDAGGHTGFPKAYNGRGLRVRPPKGSGVLFYSLLEDGNGDDFSLHAGMPVLVGTKYICNLWVWDPSRSGREVYRASDNHDNMKQNKHDEL